MNLLTDKVEYHDTIKMVPVDSSKYKPEVTFHCYWDGKLSRMHLLSIRSCYYHNIMNTNNKIILWVKNSEDGKLVDEIRQYADIKLFDYRVELDDTFLSGVEFYFQKSPSYFSDVVRYILLYKYGGCYFDLDCYFLRSMDSVFATYTNDICVYQWEKYPWPNGAIYISLQKESPKMRGNIEYIIDRAKGWGFEEARLTYDCEMDLLVLPCSWFDGGWINNPYKIRTKQFLESSDKKWTFESFFPESYSYHWHNFWSKEIEHQSPILQLDNIITTNLHK